jgi:nucleoside-diphosphate-sugar epimerase
MNNMIFILGGNGFVGSAYARVLAAQRREFTVITRANYADLAGHSCDVLINANGNSKKFLAQRAPLEEFDASVRSVRASLVDFPCQTYVYLSTVDVYPECSPEAPTAETTPLEPATQTTYGFHKHLAEQCVRHIAPAWLILRSGGFVGPGLWKNAIHDVLHGGPLWLDPSSELQFLHTDHAAELALTLIDSPCRGEVFNLCGRGVISLAEAIEATGSTVPIRSGSPCVRYEVDISKLVSRVDVPETRPTVLQFMREHLAATRAVKGAA